MDTDHTVGDRMDAVIFDMDGVILVDTEEHWQAQERVLFHDVVDADVDPEELIADLTGMYVEEIYDRLADRYPVTVDADAFLDRFNAAAEQVYAAATMMDGFPDLVRDLQDRGAKVAVATSSPHHWIDMVNDRFHLDDLVPFILSAEDIDAPGKPDPAIYHAAADRLGVDPARCVVVEDSVNGVRAAVSAGMHTIAFQPDRTAARDLADATVSSPDALRAALDSLLA